MSDTYGWDGVIIMYAEGESRGKPANPHSSGSMTVKIGMCV